MSLKLRRIELAGFRKFRDTMVIEGLSDGLCRWKQLIIFPT